MSVLPNDLVIYGCANMTEADGVTIGGAVDFTKRMMFSDVSPSGTMDVVSSSASDTATKVTWSGRDSTGVIQTSTLTCNGTTPVTGAQSYERLLYGATSGAATGGPLANPGGTGAVGDIALISHTAVVSAHTAQTGSANATGITPALIKLQAGDGSTVAVGQIVRTTGGTGPNQIRYITDTTSYGTDIVAVNRNWGTIPDNTTTYNVSEGFLFELAPNQVTAIIRPFAGIASDVAGGSTRNYYEKVFYVNNNTSIALTVASVIKQVDPSAGTLEFSLTSSLNDTGTVANRQTAPASGITAFSTGSAPQTITVPSPQNLPSGATPNAAGAQGVWLNMSLTAATAPTKTSFTIRATGQTT